MSLKLVLKRPAAQVAVSCFLGGAAAEAQTAQHHSSNTPSRATAVSTNAHDYSQGFRTFARMGLPDTAKAQYVELNHFGGEFSMATYSMLDMRLSGNAWLVSENKSDKSVLVTATGRTLELYDQKALRKKQAAEARSNLTAQASSKAFSTSRALWHMTRSNFETEEVGEWKPADLNRDLARALEFLDKKIKAKEGGGRESRYDCFARSGEGPGTLFLFAVFAWQNGKAQEANALADKLFKLAGDSRRVILGALNVMADDQLKLTSKTFEKTRDWKAYHEAVSALLKKYPAGWRKAGAAKMLAERLQTRAALTQPPPVAGEGLGEEDQKLAAALVLETPPQDRSYSSRGSLWILPPPKSAVEEKSAGVLAQITGRGLKSIPLLIALVADETYCPLLREDLNGSRSYYYGDNDMAEEERAKRDYEEMDRPLTRGEIACELLQPLCPSESEGHGGNDKALPEEIAAAAKKVYETVKALPPAALAEHFLKTGSQPQKQNAIACLLEADADTYAAAIEAYLLAPPADDQPNFGNPDEGLVRAYVEKRGEKAAAFVEKYVESLKKRPQPKGLENDERYSKQFAKQVDREIMTLRAMVKKLDFAETVNALSATDDDGAFASAAFAALRRQPAAQALPALLAAAVQATNVTVRARILQMAPSLRFAGSEEEMEKAMMAATSPDAIADVLKNIAEKNKMSIGTNAPAWKVLLADMRPVQERGFFGGDEDEASISDVAATSIEAVYGSESMMEMISGHSSAENLRPETLKKFMKLRALARLEGKSEDQLPKMPSADDVSAARRKVIDAALTKTAGHDTVAALIDTLTDAETLYLAEAMDANPAVQKAVAPLTRRIVAVTTDPALAPADAVRLAKMKGANVSTNLIAEMREVCMRQVAAGKPVGVTLASTGTGKGLELRVKPLDDVSQRRASGFSPLSGKSGKPQGSVTGIARGGDGYGHALWPVDLPAPSAPAGVAATKDDDPDDDRLDSFENMFERQQEDFENAVESFCETGKALSPGASVSFFGALPRKAKGKKGASDDDPFDQ